MWRGETIAWRWPAILKYIKSLWEPTIAVWLHSSIAGINSPGMRRSCAWQRVPPRPPRERSPRPAPAPQIHTQVTLGHFTGSETPDSALLLRFQSHFLSSSPPSPLVWSKWFWEHTPCYLWINKQKIMVGKCSWKGFFHIPTFTWYFQDSGIMKTPLPLEIFCNKSGFFFSQL